MRRFAEAPLSDIMAIDPSIEEKASVFTGKLAGKSLLIEWGAIYDRFRALKEKHKAEYISAHEKCQHSVDEAYR